MSLDPYQIEALETRMQAQTEATKDLAYAQHTANLIAWHDSLRSRKENSEAIELAEQITERLGL